MECIWQIWMKFETSCIQGFLQLLLWSHMGSNWFTHAVATQTCTASEDRGSSNIKMTSYQYRKSHCGDKTILRPLSISAIRFPILVRRHLDLESRPSCVILQPRVSLVVFALCRLNKIHTHNVVCINFNNSPYNNSNLFQYNKNVIPTTGRAYRADSRVAPSQ